jgi:hypothetical protein
MKIIDPGHRYLADGVGGAAPQSLLFVKNRGAKYPGNTGEPYGGILCQELIRILINRTEYLNSQGPCMETEHALANLRSALAWFEVRAARCRGGNDPVRSFPLPEARPEPWPAATPTCQSLRDGPAQRDRGGAPGRRAARDVLAVPQGLSVFQPLSAQCGAVFGGACLRRYLDLNTFTVEEAH